MYEKSYLFAAHSLFLFAGCDTPTGNYDTVQHPPPVRPDGPNPLRAIIDYTYDYLNRNGMRHPSLTQTWVGVDIINLISIWAEGGITYSSSIEREASTLNRFYGLMVFLLYQNIDSVMIGQPHFRGTAWIRLHRYMGNGVVASTVMGIDQPGTGFILSH